MLVPQDGFFWGTARPAWYVGMVLEVNGLPSTSAHPFPFSPIVPFGVVRESGVQLLGESVWEQLMMTPGLLTQRGIEVGMAEPPGVQLLLLLQVQQAHSSVGSAKQSLDSLAGVENLSC